MRIWSGDIIQTKIIDSGGVDENSITVALYGKPQTGLFYIAGADVGDVLAIRIKNLRLNRNYADSLNMIVNEAQTTRMAARNTDLGHPIQLEAWSQKRFGKPRACVPVI